jgi:hypothetical protein|tara:strand:+ start:1557 stop:1718 length:162 start_codon:yes stop_codon:yes gene_type:complete
MNPAKHVCGVVKLLAMVRFVVTPGPQYVPKGQGNGRSGVPKSVKFDVRVPSRQ